jgi:hypothetical protein
LNKIGPDDVLSEAELIEIGKQITFTELQASNAEKELKSFERRKGTQDRADPADAQRADR